MRGPIFTLMDYLTGSDVTIVDVAIAFFSVLVIIFVVFPIHECAHAIVANKLGDDTAERQGRVTLNPFVHIDPMGALMMCLCNIGWAKPTPVDLRRCHKVKIRTANVLVSIAGPLANLILSFLFFVISYTLSYTIGDSSTVSIIVMALNYAATVNIYLAVLNLLPIPGFDGFQALTSFLPPKAVYWVESRGQIIHWVVMILLITGILSIPISIISMFIELGMTIPLNWLFGLIFV